MEASERDTTEEWEIPPARGPLLIGEIEDRVDVAIAIARASEEGVKEVGAAAIDAAQQARRAAELAEAASAAAAEARDAVAAHAAAEAPAPASAQAAPEPDEGGEAGAESGPPQPAPPQVEPPPPVHPAPRLSGEARMRRFSERCDRVSARLRALERRPGAPAAASAAEARRRGDG